MFSVRYLTSYLNGVETQFNLVLSNDWFLYDMQDWSGKGQPFPPCAS